MLQVLLALLTVAASPAPTQTIVMIRHGEKPVQGLGQLACQGLNRALALPAIIARDFGRPAAIFAPNPAVAKEDQGKSYDYVRPLATIEPTAIAFGLPVDVSIGFADIATLAHRLDDPSLRSGVVLVAWEHLLIVQLARILLQAHGADAAVVPDWPGTDFDSVYVVKVTREGGAIQAKFEHRQEGLNGQPTGCPDRVPGPAPR